MSRVMCDFCDTESASLFKVSRSLEYKGDLLTVEGYHVHRCDNCEEQFTTAADARVNERLFLDAKRKYDGLMTGSEIVDWRRKLGISQDLASQLFGGGKNAFSKYERSEVSQSVAADRLMRIAELYPAVLFDLARMQNVCLPQHLHSWRAHEAMPMLINLPAPTNSWAVQVVPGNSNSYKGLFGTC